MVVAVPLQVRTQCCPNLQRLFHGVYRTVLVVVIVLRGLLFVVSESHLWRFAPKRKAETLCVSGISACFPLGWRVGANPRPSEPQSKRNKTQPFDIQLFMLSLCIWGKHWANFMPSRRALKMPHGARPWGGCAASPAASCVQLNGLPAAGAFVSSAARCVQSMANRPLPIL